MPRPLKLGILDDCTIILSKDIHKNASKYFFMDLPIRGQCLKFAIHKWPVSISKGSTWCNVYNCCVVWQYGLLSFQTGDTKLSKDIIEF